MDVSLNWRPGSFLLRPAKGHRWNGGTHVGRGGAARTKSRQRERRANAARAYARAATDVERGLARCVDALDPPVRTIDEVNREFAAYVDQLHANLGTQRPTPRSWSRKVYSDLGEEWASAGAAAFSLGRNQGHVYKCISLGIACVGRTLSYSKFPGVTYKVA